MDWLKTHEYLAPWLSLPLMVVLTIFQVWKGSVSGKSVNMALTVLFFAFFICIAVTFTPAIEVEARFFAGFMAFALMWVVVYHADKNSN